MTSYPRLRWVNGAPVGEGSKYIRLRVRGCGEVGYRATSSLVTPGYWATALLMARHGLVISISCRVETQNCLARIFAAPTGSN